MKKYILPLIVAAFLISTISTAYAFTAPKSIAGISLDEDYHHVKSMLDLDSMDSQWNEDYLKRIEILPMQGYRSGYIVIGNCKNKDSILKVKLNYSDDSVGFFNKMYSILRKRYGEPADWRGNPFGTLKIWKWSLKDDIGNISLILHHFSGDDDSTTQGNSIKLSRPSFIKDERLCWEKLHPDSSKKVIPPKIKGFNWYLPY